MSLLAPLALVGLAAIPVIVALYMLRMRRPERTVSSTWLWTELVRDVEANAPWQRLRRSLLLLLQLLCALLLVAVLVRPVLERPATLAHDLVLVVDASASMSATDVPLDRLDAARRAAIQVLDGLPAGGRVSIIEAGDTARVVANEVTDPARAARAIDSIRASTGTGDMAEALRLADALAARATGSEVIVVTDGAGIAPTDVRVRVPVRVVPVGRERHNQAIAALAVDIDPGGLRRQAFVSIANQSDVVVTRRLQLLADGVPFTARDLRLPVMSRTDVVIDEVPRGARILEARLSRADATAAGETADVPDHLALDDAAWAVVPEDRTRQILVIGPAGVFLRTALSLLPDVELYGVSAAEWTAGTARDGDWDLVVLDGVIADPLPATPILAIAPPTDSALGDVLGALTAPTIGEPATDEPLLRDVDLTRLHVARAQRIELPSWARVVLPGPTDVPLIYSGVRDGLPTTVLAFALEQSDLPLQVAWPILAANITGELLGRDPSASQPVRPGAVVQLPVPPDASGLRITLPDGTVREVEPGVAGDGLATFVETRQLGVYRVEPIPKPGVDGPDARPSDPGASSPTPASASPGPAATTPAAVDLRASGTRWFAVDLFEPTEAAITPSDGSALVALGTPAPEAPATAGVARDEWWPLLLLVLLGVLTVEWLVYERDGARRIRDRLRALVPGRATGASGPSGTAGSGGRSGTR
ncbi:MAG: BatA domain-containing protein [Chloroflexi bacterium]|nr:BatA domain-containing protein [Chloroflexota bacterium]